MSSSPTFSGAGVVVGLFFLALSLLPSLLPRAGYVQGIASGVTFMVGYGIGAVCQALWAYLADPGPARAGAHRSWSASCWP